MKINRFFAAALAMATMISATACDGKKDKSSTGENEIIMYNQGTTSAPVQVVTKAPTEPVVAAEDGPRLYINDVTVKAGEVAEVTVSIENADMAWSMCGIHLVYPNVLDPEMIDEEKRYVRKKMGDASEYNVGSVAMEWQFNFTEEMIENNLGSIFFTEMFDGDYGMNGDIVTFFIKVPDDAVSGTEYPVDFKFFDGDMFINTAEDRSIEKYVFENWRGGKIIVE